MDMISLSFNLALLFCATYASIYGGQTGKAGSAIYIVTTILCNIARLNPWRVGTSIWLFALDGTCLKALVILAHACDRYWPIWATGQ